MQIRVGTGTDVHGLVEGPRLIIGGVEIDHPMGLKGHSDADVLLHAVCDALLGAAGLGDIGEHFPDTDPAFKGMDSTRFLQICKEKVRAKGFMVGNLDCTIFAQAPRMSPHKKAMAACIARVLELSPDCVNIKATTTEHLGFIGRKEGIAAQATVLLYKNES
ncbi:2-C-methyl-D-erythritol 2,4-cyclodiphosphate synthase [uncultured Desulfobacter sp.]|uniref:2-C-methyl-D-erythritol 2,4-cyclodiphosphate synthase n=1 Tax=uncultured Desulfobacter sp. TaxID=240139 RepID=UPI002AAC22DC|nr:2-C-methyl-D-erythritol 2,4-cyclodiphosphate synthase [uncultured Desulfobacter sp.]